MKARSPLLNAIADYMLSRHYSLKTVEAYLKWIIRSFRYEDNANIYACFTARRKRCC